jgi:hypothetical protein
MPEWVPDTTGRFVLRPKYRRAELEAICAEAINFILTQRHKGDCDRAVSEDDLAVLIERHGADLEVGADMPLGRDWLQGCTMFRPDGPPLVQIASSLAPDRFANRRKFTLGHEWGHLIAQQPAFERPGNVCESNLISLCRCSGNRAPHDWAEWQANYCAGALLIPSDTLRHCIGDAPARNFRLFDTSNRAHALIEKISLRFDTSFDAARVRLLELGYIRRQASPPQISLPFPEIGDDSMSRSSQTSP